MLELERTIKIQAKKVTHFSMMVGSTLLSPKQLASNITSAVIGFSNLQKNT